MQPCSLSYLCSSVVQASNKIFPALFIPYLDLKLCYRALSNRDNGAVQREGQRAKLESTYIM